MASQDYCNQCFAKERNLPYEAAARDVEAIERERAEFEKSFPRGNQRGPI